MSGAGFGHCSAEMNGRQMLKRANAKPAQTSININTPKRWTLTNAAGKVYRFGLSTERIHPMQRKKEFSTLKWIIFPANSVILAGIIAYFNVSVFGWEDGLPYTLIVSSDWCVQHHHQQIYRERKSKPG